MDISSLIQDVKYAARRLARSPGLTVVAVVTLALGIGATTAMFSVVEAALLRSLPFVEPGRIVHFWRTFEGSPGQHGQTSYPNFADFEDQLQSFDGLAAYAGRTFTVLGDQGAERISGGRVTTNFFSLLGTRPLHGRDLRAEDVEAGGLVAVLDHGYWQDRLGGDPGVLGTTLTMNGDPYTVVGILPPDFQFAPHGERGVWVPLVPLEVERETRGRRFLRVIGRLAPGVTPDQAQAEVSALMERLDAAYPAELTGDGMRLESLHEHIVGPVRPILLALLGAVGFVLLITCANVANLLLGSAVERGGEMSVRAALGAGRLRLVRQVLTESLMLALLGGAAGLAIAYYGVAFLGAALPGFMATSMPYLEDVGVNGGVLAFALSVSLGTGVLFGLAPAIHSSRVQLADALREGGRGRLGSRHRLRRALLVAEVAVSLVLLVGAGLLVQSATRLLRVDPGFGTRDLLSLEVFLPADRYESAEAMTSFFDDALGAIEAQPGVVAAATVNKVPIHSTGNTGSLAVESAPAPPGQEPEANVRTVSDAYFTVMGIGLVEGRTFDRRDDSGGAPVMVINEGLARDLFGGRSAVGERIGFVYLPDTWFEVVGVVEDVKLDGLDAAAPPVVYVSARQDPNVLASLVVRTTVDPVSVAGPVRNELLARQPLAAISNVASMRQIIDTSPAVVLRRYPAQVLTGFAVLALLLVAIGLYGVMRYSVTRRTREIGIRIALGASPAGIIARTVREGLRVAATGIAIGAAGALLLTRFLESVLFGVRAIDGLTMLGGALLVAATAAVATYLPSRRASRVDPAVALRHE